MIGGGLSVLEGCADGGGVWRDGRTVTVWGWGDQV